MDEPYHGGLTVAACQALHRRFWAGTLDRHLFGFFIPNPAARPFPGMDQDLAEAELIAKNRQAAAWFNATPDERMPTAWVNYGPVFLAALAGGEIAWDNSTSWARHADEALPLADLHLPPFAPDGNPWWQRYLRHFRALRAAGVPDAMLGLSDMIGPFDLLAALIGTERLCLEMMGDPDEVVRLGQEATRFWLAVHAAHFALLPDPAGTSDCFGLFCPGRGSRWSEDFIALIGPELYQEFVMPCDLVLAESLDTSYMHVHSAALPCLEHILALPALSGVEISNDPNGPPLGALVEWAQEARRRGKAVMLSNWQRQLSVADHDLLANGTSPGGTVITLEAPSVAAAQAIADRYR